jgi:hypothetical protein
MAILMDMDCGDAKSVRLKPTLTLHPITTGTMVPDTHITDTDMPIMVIMVSIPLIMVFAITT